MYKHNRKLFRKIDKKLKILCKTIKIKLKLINNKSKINNKLLRMLKIRCRN